MVKLFLPINTAAIVLFYNILTEIPGLTGKYLTIRIKILLFKLN
jgi:hypothetical protein